MFDKWKIRHRIAAKDYPPCEARYWSVWEWLVDTPTRLKWEWFMFIK